MYYCPNAIPNIHIKIEALLVRKLLLSIARIQLAFQDVEQMAGILFVCKSGTSDLVDMGVQTYAVSLAFLWSPAQEASCAGLLPSLWTLGSR